MIVTLLEDGRTWKKADLATALDVVQLFMKPDPLPGRATVEQLEECLIHMITGQPLEPDTLEYIKRVEAERRRLRFAGVGR